MRSDSAGRQRKRKRRRATTSPEKGVDRRKRLLCELQQRKAYHRTTLDSDPSTVHARALQGLALITLLLLLTRSCIDM